MKKTTLLAIFIFILSCSTPDKGSTQNTESLGLDITEEIERSIAQEESDHMINDVEIIEVIEEEPLENFQVAKNMPKTKQESKQDSIEDQAEDLSDEMDLSEVALQSDSSDNFDNSVNSDKQEALESKAQVTNHNEFNEEVAIDKAQKIVDHDLIVKNGEVRTLEQPESNFSNQELNSLIGLKTKSGKKDELNGLLGLSGKPSNEQKLAKKTLLPSGFIPRDQKEIEIANAYKERDKKIKMQAQLEKKKNLQQSMDNSRLPASFTRVVGIRNDTDIVKKKYRDRAVIYAAKHAVGETVEYLVKEKGLDINVVDNSGKTALHHAVQNRRIGIVLRLLKIGADKKIKDSQGETPLDIAMKENNEKLIKLLK